ncbi:hypothetical protein EDC56_2153 [Sinobacterium caligoides]|uniref:2OG-Fe dioxygenase family protein n=1 Tax=Sinobacterium caligoides TaxID=933926 RepID=A0A3N2DPG6_9GAMM|nr:2OG-Fe dioxygenase family protein [Sinobacterium caligoides]ROS01708.1 hypothetical protein EDC56_2153 [Sinobacterium caligoides]
MNIVNGFKFLNGRDQFDCNVELSRVRNHFIPFFDHAIEIDPFSSVRKRSYIKLRYNITTGLVSVADNQQYFQTGDANVADGGKIREFHQTPSEFIDTELFRVLLKNNKEYLERYSEQSSLEEMTLGIHLIRYDILEGDISYASPVWLHVDNEPLVFVHLIDLSLSVIGGDNIIADSNSNPTHVVRLENFMDTLILDKSVQHAVTPLSSKNGQSKRDVILFTVEDTIQNAS